MKFYLFYFVLYRHPCLVNASIILFLNKKDVLGKKLSQVPFNHTFVNYRGVNDTDGVINYIKKLFEKRSGDRLIYTHVTQATDRENLALVFGAVQDYIIAQRMKKSGMDSKEFEVC